ncbi:Mu transposase C-terminal domain-containing protein [Thalassobius sp. S69A]|uniref:Mu transposase C-terminal domain-containing protein n=1 Tax=unclassified Thalassovita TaxID=2619711 RepID=UPI003C7BB267
MADSSQTQVYFSAREMAELAKSRGITNFPHTERRVRDYAVREGWNDLPETLCRKRPGRGGGLEYHFSLLPEGLRASLDANFVRASAVQRHEAQAVADQAKLDAVRSHALPPRARAVMEARAEILTSIDGFAIANGQKRAWGISQFLDAQDEYLARQDIEARRENGEFLTEREVESLAYPLVLTASDGFQLDPERLKVANDRRVVATIKRSAVYAWFKTRSDAGIVALAPTPPKAQAPIHPGFSDFLKFYAIGSKPSAADALRQYLKTDPPKEKRLSLTQVQYILRNRLNNIEKHVGREGLLTLRSRMAYVTRTTEGMWPTTIYSADGKTFDAEIADPVSGRPIRPEITTVIDVVTRKIVGISLARSENRITVAEALRRSCQENGICAIFYVDRGPGYKNKAMDADVSGLMGRLGITKMHAAPFGSQAKGRIEKPNDSVWNTLAKRLPTYIGPDMDKEAGQKVHKMTRRDLDQFGQSRLLPEWADFVAMCEAMVDEHNNKPHRGLPKFRDPETGKKRHLTPNESWASHVADGFEPVTIDQDEADDLFRPYEIRVARRAEVQWNTNTYFHHELERYHEQKVMVGYDYHQADKVWVREFDVESGQPGRLICVAEFMGNAQRYVPLSYERKAVEDRAKGRLRRLARKVETVEAERGAPTLVEHLNEVPMVDITPAEEPVTQPVEVVNPPEMIEPAAPRRRTFESDEELALWALDNPEEISPKQAALLMDCLQRPIATQALELAGVDTEALWNLLRAVA